MTALRRALQFACLSIVLSSLAGQAWAGAMIEPPDNRGLGGVISEVRGGVLYHDFEQTSHAEDGVDINAEILFTSPGFMKYVFSPRPHLGASVNSVGQTSQFYFGLSWTADIYDRFFAEVSFGGTVHDGDLDETNDSRNDLGCRWLFRTSASLGVIFAERHSLSGMFDHISNGGFCNGNEGLNTLGLRYGIRF